MARLGGSGIKWQNIFVVILFVAVGLYLFGAFSVETPAGREFAIPEDVDATILMVFKIIMIAALTFGSYALWMKLSRGALTKKDAFTIILIGVGIILLWDKIAPILNAESIDSITFAVGQKFGLFP